MEDKIIVCRNCGKEFTFAVGEQKFYEEKGIPCVKVDSNNKM